MKKSTSFKINPQVWRLAKSEAADLGLFVGEWIEKLILQELEKINHKGD